MKIAILITNPNHHVDLTIEVAMALKQLGHTVKYISLCEIRRMPSPKERFLARQIDFEAFPPLPGQLKPSSGKVSLGSDQGIKRRVVRSLFWHLKIRPFIKKAINGLDLVLLMNDAAFPGDRIVYVLKRRKIPFDLLQEGIRFPLPNESDSHYGGAGARKIYAWGERSALHFEKVKSKGSQVVVTGSPRFDQFMELLSSNPIHPTERILGVFTNPIDDQGFCSHSEKMLIFENFVKRSAEHLNKEAIALGIKCHPREDEQEYLLIAKRHVNKIMLLPKEIIKAIQWVEAGVIMASTVGLELLAAGKGLAQLEIPNYGYVFDYQESDNYLPIPLNGAIDLTNLRSLNRHSDYFESHVQAGKSSDNLVKAITSKC